MAEDRANPPNCCVPGCQKKARYKTECLCAQHYSYRQKNGRFEPEPKIVEPLPLSPTDAAWLAGIVDGEGHIGLVLAKSAQGGYSPILHIVNTDPRMLERIEAITGMAKTRYRPAKGHWKPQWRWEIQSIAAIRSILLAIRPYLVIKGEQAALLLKLPVIYKSCPEMRQQILRAIRQLHHLRFPDRKPPGEAN